MNKIVNATYFIPVIVCTMHIENRNNRQCLDCIYPIYTFLILNAHHTNTKGGIAIMFFNLIIENLT